MSKRARTAGFALVVGFVAVAAANGCGTEDYVVGGECAATLVQCGHTCASLSSDPDNCGACGNSCVPGVACGGGTCGGTLDGSTDGHGDGVAPYDGMGSSDGTTEGSLNDGDNGNKEAGMHVDGGEAGTSDGSSGDATTGDDGASDGAIDDGSASDAEGGLVCTPPTMLCHGVCIDTTGDPSNCGACDNVCPTFLCASSQCESGFNGEVVLLGEDFVAPVPTNGSQQRVLTNTVFIRPFAPLRILAYDRYASASATSQVSSILTTHGAQTSQPVTYTETMTDSDIPTNLDVSNYDILFVYDQASAATGVLGPLGTSWATTLAMFLSHGGFIVVLDGAGGTTQEMGTFLTSAGLFNVTSQTSMANGTRVDNTAVNDSVGRNVAFFGVTNDAARFSLDPPSASIAYVFTDLAANQPVIVHKTF